MMFVVAKKKPNLKNGSKTKNTFTIIVSYWNIDAKIY